MKMSTDRIDTEKYHCFGDVERAALHNATDSDVGQLKSTMRVTGA
jgi:hypothetical protein